MNHISKQSLIAYVMNDITISDREEIERHIETCDECAKKFSIIKSFVSPSVDDISAPSETVYVRIMRHCRKVFENPQKSPLSRRFAIPLVSAASIIIIVGAIFLHFLNIDSYGIHTAHIRGTAAANSVKLEIGKSLATGSILTTGDKSHVFLESRSLRLKAGSHTSLQISKIVVNHINGKAVYDLILDKGTVAAKIGPSIHHKYTVTTPHAIISSQDSNLIVKVDDDQTLLVVKSGNAILSSLKGDSIEATGGSSYVISQAGDDPEEDSLVEKTTIDETGLRNDYFD
jgi:hypothetical protein